MQKLSVSQIVFASLTVGLLSGCSASFTPSAITPERVPIGNIQGTVHGGQAPISGAQIYLYAAGTGGYGTSATSLISSTAPNAFEDGNGNYYVKTDSNGNFALGGDYTCTEGQQVYMVAVGGNPGLTGSVNNTAIVQMAALAQCPAAGNLAAQVPYLVINEVTTVAFAYAMGGFGTDATHIGSSNTTAGQQAIANAMLNANNIVNLGQGVALTVANGTAKSVAPQAKIYWLANALGGCVNSSGPSTPGCTALFSAATNSVGAVTASTEDTAIFNIVHNPADTATNMSSGNSHVFTIWNNLKSSTPVFTAASPLTQQPADWTMPVIYTGLVSLPATSGNTITSGPFNIAFDAKGNAWIGDRVNGVVKVGPQGASNAYNPGFGMIKGVAVSPADGTIWAADFGSNIVDVLNSSGTVVTTVSTNITPRKHGPILAAFTLDPSTGFLADVVNESVPSVVMFEANPTTPYFYSKVANDVGSTHFPNVDTPGWIAIDQTGKAWVPSTDSAWVGDITLAWKNGNHTLASNEAGGPESYSTAGDGNDNIWTTTDTGTAQLEEITAGSTTPTGTPITGGGMNEPFKLAVDGANTVWIANDGANTVSAYSSTGKAWLATNGFSTSAASGTGAVVIGVDGSGNVWTGNADGSVTQLLGLATPTAAPFYGGMTVTTGTAPNQTTVITNGNLGSKP